MSERLLKNLWLKCERYVWNKCCVSLWSSNILMQTVLDTQWITNNWDESIMSVWVAPVAPTCLSGPRKLSC